MGGAASLGRCNCFAADVDNGEDPLHSVDYICLYCHWTPPRGSHFQFCGVCGTALTSVQFVDREGGFGRKALLQRTKIEMRVQNTNISSNGFGGARVPSMTDSEYNRRLFDHRSMSTSIDGELSDPEIYADSRMADLIAMRDDSEYDPSTYQHTNGVSTAANVNSMYYVNDVYDHGGGALQDAIVADRMSEARHNDVEKTRAAFEPGSPRSRLPEHYFPTTYQARD